MLLLGGAYLFGHIAHWLGFRSDAFCAMAAFLQPFAFTGGVIVATVGVAVWGASRFRSDAGLGLLLGGGLLAVLPGVMPRYFGLVCTLSP